MTSTIICMYTFTPLLLVAKVESSIKTLLRDRLQLSVNYRYCPIKGKFHYHVDCNTTPTMPVYIHYANIC